MKKFYFFILIILLFFFYIPSAFSQGGEVRESFYHYIYFSYGTGNAGMSARTSLGQNIETYPLSLFPYPTSEQFPVSFPVPQTHPTKMYSECIKFGGEYRPIPYLGIYYSIAKVNYHIPMILKHVDLFYINQLKQNTQLFLPVSSISGSYAKPGLGLNVHILGDGLFDIYFGFGGSAIGKYPTGTGQIGIQLNFSNNVFFTFQGEGEYAPKITFRKLYGGESGDYKNVTNRIFTFSMGIRWGD